MRCILYVLLGICIASNAFGQDRPATKRPEAASYSTRDATVISMMGWGVILAAISAGVSVLFKDSPESSTAH